MEREINFYVSCDKVYCVLCGLEGSITSFFRKVYTKDKASLEKNEIHEMLNKFLFLGDDEFLSHSVNTPFLLLGYKSFPELFKKTTLFTLRVEKTQIITLRAVKNKRWYEFQPLGYNFDMDDISINNLSIFLYDILISPDLTKVSESRDF